MSKQYTKKKPKEIICTACKQTFLSPYNAKYCTKNACQRERIHRNTEAWIEREFKKLNQ